MRVRIDVRPSCCGLFLVCLLFTWNVEASEDQFVTRLVCITITNPDTGDTEKWCRAYSIVTDSQKWNFLLAVSALYVWPETSLGANYDSWYKDIQIYPIEGCASALTKVADMSGTWLERCKTVTELFWHHYDSLEDWLVDWFWDNNGCEATINGLVAASGFGAVRSFIKTALREQVKRAIKGMTKSKLKTLIGQTGSAFIAGFSGYLVGGKLEELICDYLESL